VSIMYSIPYRCISSQLTIKFILTHCHREIQIETWRKVRKRETKASEKFGNIPALNANSCCLLVDKVDGTGRL